MFSSLFSRRHNAALDAEPADLTVSEARKQVHVNIAASRRLNVYTLTADSCSALDTMPFGGV
jgi:hypothetical protein